MVHQHFILAWLYGVSINYHWLSVLRLVRFLIFRFATRSFDRTHFCSHDLRCTAQWLWLALFRLSVMSVVIWNYGAWSGHLRAWQWAKSVSLSNEKLHLITWLFIESLLASNTVLPFKICFYIWDEVARVLLWNNLLKRNSWFNSPEPTLRVLDLLV
jgi:hypothetical protein